MNITLPSGMTAHLIGDPHAGKKFETGVPLHRRGEREKHQMERFRRELAEPCDYNVCVGDLFDHPYVSYSVTLSVAAAYIEAALRTPETIFIALAGNHDLSRNLSVAGAFDAFEKMVAGVANIFVVRKPCAIGEMALFPWEWGVPAVEQLKGLTLGPAMVAIGHFDLRSYGGDDSHLAPVDELNALGITEIYSGHYHLPGDYDVASGLVHCTGSMEPYSHAEDPAGEMYVTLTLAEAMDGRDLNDKNVRLILEEGEEVPYDLDCMALTFKRSMEHTEQLQTMGTADFDWRGIMEEALSPLDPEVKTFILDRIGS